MNDHTDKSPAETPMARALRMKRAASETRPKPPGGASAFRKDVAGVAAGASKPWLKK